MKVSVDQPVVFVTQLPHKRNRSGDWVASINISPASKFGVLKILLDHQVTIVDAAPIIDQLYEKLEEYSYERGDTLIMIGDPAIIAIAAAVLSSYTDRFRILKWDNTVHVYTMVEINLQ